MTRRITLAILVTVWSLILVGGGIAYAVTRALLLEDLDAAILARVAMLPELEPATVTDPAMGTVDPGDRYVLNNRGIARRRTPEAAAGAAVAPVLDILDARFTKLGDGTRLRTLTVRAPLRRAEDGPAEMATVVYSGPAGPFDSLLNKLIAYLIGFGAVAGAGTAAVARGVAGVALRPLREAAEELHTIDERSLDRRIAVDRLPPDLAPVGRRLNDLLARLETAFAQRRQFLGDASHELRTPVAALVTALEVALRRRREPDEYVRTLETCLADAQLLHGLVTSLLAQVRSERFAAELEIGPVAVVKLLRQCGRQAETLAAGKGVAVEVALPAEVVLLTDEQKLRSIVTNLLANAVEYTPAGGRVSLAVDVLPTAVGPAALPAGVAGAIPEGVTAAPRQLIVRVADTGPGIAAAHQPHLFEPFYRADAARTNPEHHLGLGLSIVQNAARALGGECTVQSPRGPGVPGSEFTLRVPTVAVGGGDAGGLKNPEPDVAKDRPKVMTEQALIHTGDSSGFNTR
jgi:signal transduction histidine kinase